MHSNEKTPSTKQKPQSAHIPSGSSSSQTQPKKSFDELIQDLNKFIEKNKITKQTMIEDDNIFYSFDDFRTMLQSIHYNISSSYMKVLFNGDEKNENKEDFKFMKTFTKNLNFFKIEEISNVNETSNTQSNFSDSIYSSSTNKKDKSVYEMNYLNEEFSKFNQEINNILKDDSRNPTSNYSNKRTRVATAKPKTSKIVIDSSNNKKTNQSQSSLFPSKSLNQTQSSKILEEQPTNKSKKYNANKIINKRTKEKQKEEENIKTAFKKKDQAFVKDCVIKSVECNKMCEEMKIPKYYEVGYSKSGEIGCFITDDEKKCIFVSLQAFIVEWRRLNKAYQQRDIEERYAVKEDEKKKKEDVNAIVNQRMNEKNERLKEVKDVLIETVRLKTKLKNQLDNLQKKIKISEKVVIEHLVKAGIDIPGVYNETKSTENNKTKEEEKISNQL